MSLLAFLGSSGTCQAKVRQHDMVYYKTTIYFNNTANAYMRAISTRKPGAIINDYVTGCVAKLRIKLFDTSSTRRSAFGSSRTAGFFHDLCMASVCLVIKPSMGNSHHGKEVRPSRCPFADTIHSLHGPQSDLEGPYFGVCLVGYPWARKTLVAKATAAAREYELGTQLTLFFCLQRSRAFFSLCSGQASPNNDSVNPRSTMAKSVQFSLPSSASSISSSFNLRSIMHCDARDAFKLTVFLVHSADSSAERNAMTVLSWMLIEVPDDDVTI